MMCNKLFHVTYIQRTAAVLVESLYLHAQVYMQTILDSTVN